MNKQKLQLIRLPCAGKVTWRMRSFRMQYALRKCCKKCVN